MSLLDRVVQTATPTLIVTAFPSIASAQEAVRRGAVDYLTKPASAQTILRILSNDVEPESEFQLDLRAIRQVYIDLVVKHCGTHSRAARVLGVDRRSLRRMLTRNAFGSTIEA